jgi:hypothetical protein
LWFHLAAGWGSARAGASRVRAGRKQMMTKDMMRMSTKRKCGTLASSVPGQRLVRLK